MNGLDCGASVVPFGCFAPPKGELTLLDPNVKPAETGGVSFAGSAGLLKNDPPKGEAGAA